MDTTPPPTPGPSTPDLAGRTFVGVTSRGRALVPGSTVRLTFDAGRLTVRAGCNTMFGEATWTDGVLDAGRLASTRMACPPELMAQDDWLAALLTSRPTIALVGADLLVGDETAGLVLRAE